MSHVIVHQFRFRLFQLTAGLLFGVAGCTAYGDLLANILGGDTPSPGTAGGACLADGTCADGLTCSDDNTCVARPADEDGRTDESEVDPPAPDDDLIISCVTYVDTPGQAKILRVEDAPPGECSCPNDPVAVYYEFIPDVPEAEPPRWYDEFDHEDGWRLRIGAGMHPPRAWVLQEGLTPGSFHRCIRRHIATTSRLMMPNPIVFKFPDLDWDAAFDLCW